MKFALAPLAVLALALSACSGSASRRSLRAATPAFEGPDAGFLTAVAAPSHQYQLYWLGTEFEVGGLVFKGPFAQGFQDFASPDGLTTRYLSKNGGFYYPDVSIDLYSQHLWAQFRSARLPPPGADVTRKDVVVAQHDAQLVIIDLGSGRANTEIVIDFGDTVVVAQTSLSPTAPAPNPLADEATFISVLQNLRPYPQ